MSDLINLSGQSRNMNEDDFKKEMKAAERNEISDRLRLLLSHIFNKGIVIPDWLVLRDAILEKSGFEAFDELEKRLGFRIEHIESCNCVRCNNERTLQSEKLSGNEEIPQEGIQEPISQKVEVKETKNNEDQKDKGEIRRVENNGVLDLSIDEHVKRIYFFEEVIRLLRVHLQHHTTRKARKIKDHEEEIKASDRKYKPKLKDPNEVETRNYTKSEQEQLDERAINAIMKSMKINREEAIKILRD